MDSLDINTPLIVDLDGTLVKTDTLLESMVKLLIKNPLYLFCLPLWVLAGRVYFKKKIAEKVRQFLINIDQLLFNFDQLRSAVDQILIIMIHFDRL